MALVADPKYSIFPLMPLDSATLPGATLRLTPPPHNGVGKEEDSLISTQMINVKVWMDELCLFGICRIPPPCTSNGWNLKMKVWKIFLFKEVICRFHVDFPGCSVIFFNFWRWKHRSLRESDFSNMYCSVRSKIEPTILYWMFPVYPQNITYLTTWWTFEVTTGQKKISQKDGSIRVFSFLKKTCRQQKIMFCKFSDSKIQSLIVISSFSENLHWLKLKSPAFQAPKVDLEKLMVYTGEVGVLFVYFVCCVFFQETCLESEHFLGWRIIVCVFF